MVRVPLLSETFMLIRSGKQLPANQAMFRVPVSFGRKQIAEYLKKIYQLPVLGVNTLNRQGATKRSHYNQGGRPKFYKRPDFKIAYVKFDGKDIQNPFAL